MDSKENHRLPVLVSIPHGGIWTPPELLGKVNLNDFEMLGESDAFTHSIYDIGDAALAGVYKSDVARALVDLNRPPDHLPPRKLDGVIKDVTTYGIKVYKEDMTPDEALIKSLLGRYYFPYHESIAEALATPGLKLALDCHSMASAGPTLARDAGQRRPLICLGNVRGKSCRDPVLERLKECFVRSFGLKDEDVALNRPFSGGYITRHYGMNPVPWVQVEISRALYLEYPWFDQTTLEMDPSRLAELNLFFKEALLTFFGQ